MSEQKTPSEPSKESLEEAKELIFMYQSKIDAHREQAKEAEKIIQFALRIGCDCTSEFMPREHSEDCGVHLAKMAHEYLSKPVSTFQKGPAK